MNLTELIARYRLEATDNACPPFVSDQDATMWFNDAERQAAIRGRLIREDSIDALTNLVFVVDQTTYRLHPAVYEIISLRLVPMASPTRTRPITLKSREWMDRFCRDWRTEPTRWDDWAIQDDKSLRFVGKYEAGDIMQLECYRTPLKKMKVGNDVPEIAEIHHEQLVHWVLHKAFNMPDPDLFDPKKAAEAEAAFTDYFGPMPDSDLRRSTRTDQVHHNDSFF